MFIQEDLSFDSDFGQVHYSLYLPKVPNGSIIQIAHGMIEERSKYQELAVFLVQRGYVVAINDHRGHGESIGGKSGKYRVMWGEMGENGFFKAVEDLYMLSCILKKRFNGYSLFLLGHSMGSLFARCYLQKYEDQIQALLLMGSPSPNRLAGVGIGLCEVLMKCKMHGFGIKLMNLMTLVGFNHKFKKQDSHSPSYAWLTREIQISQKFMDQASYQFSFTLNSFKNLFKGLKQVFSPYPHVSSPSLPILFMSGDDDPCGEFGKGVYKAYKHLCSQGYYNVSLRLYSGARHELLLERNKNTIMLEIAEFFDAVRTI